MKKIGLILAFSILIGLVWSLEFDKFLSLAEESQFLTSQDSVLYLACPNGIAIYDYSNQTLDLVNVINYENYHSSNRVYSSGNYLMNRPNSTSGQILYDITDRFNPVEVATFNFSYFPNFQVIGNSLYILEDSLYVYDTSDFSLPPTTLLGPYSSYSNFALIDNKLVITNVYTGNTGALIEVYDINSPTDIEFVDSYELIHDSGRFFMVIQNQRLFIREKSALHVFDYIDGLELLQSFGPLPYLYNEDIVSSKANDSVLISIDGYYWDISDVENIEMYSDWTAGNVFPYFGGPTIIGNHFFRPDWDFGLVIVDMSDIENVEIIYDMSSYSNNVGIDIVGNTLLDVAHPKLRMFDVSDSENIQQIESLEEEEWNRKFDKFIVAEDKLLLTHDEFMTVLTTENGVSQPEFCSDINLGTIGQIAYYNDHLYNVDAANLQMQITDLSDPEAPQILGSSSISQIVYAPINSWVIDHYLLLVNEYMRVSVYDLSIPNLPQHLSSFNFNTLLGTSYLADNVKFIAKDNLVFVSFTNFSFINPGDFSNIYIFNIDDIENWILLNSIPFNLAGSYDIELVGDYLYTANIHGQTEIKMYEVNSFGSYEELATYSTNVSNTSCFVDMDIHNNRLYLGRGYSLLVYEISFYTENDSYEIVPSNQISSYNYPNPFNPETTISFDLPQRDKVELVVYNLKGQKVKSLINEEMDMGVHKIIWNGTNNQGKEVASGVYYYRLTSANYTKTNKMVLMK